MAVLSAVVEAWVVHFTCEDDSIYQPTWQFDAELLHDNVYVVHFVHDLAFTKVVMYARWRDGMGTLQQVDGQLLTV
jgi:hypothetical protein